MFLLNRRNKSVHLAICLIIKETSLLLILETNKSAIQIRISRTCNQISNIIIIQIQVQNKFAINTYSCMIRQALLSFITSFIIYITFTQLYQQMEGCYQEETMFSDQQLFRVQSEQLNTLLHRSIGCLVFLDRYKKMGNGSGFLISPNIILTAAHNVYNQKTLFEHTNFKFYLGVDGVAEEYHEIEAWRYLEEFKTCPQYNKLPFDYAVMKLKKPVEFDKYLPLSVPCQICLLKDQKQEVGVFGFPRIKNNLLLLCANGKRMQLYQYGLSLSSRIQKIDAANCLIRYGISTQKGQSGCPVVVYNAVIAIHAGGNQKVNIGRIIEPSLIENALKWTYQLNKGQHCFAIQNYPCSHEQQRKTCLRVGQRKLKTIDLSLYSRLLELDLSVNYIGLVELKICPNLVKLDLSSNQLRFIDLREHFHLIYLNLNNNKLETIDVCANTDLAYLNLSNNQLESIDVRENIELVYLYLNSNKLQKMEVSSNIRLVHLYLSMNSLQYMDVRPNIHLAHLKLDNNKLQTMDVRANIHLTHLYLWNNNLQKMDVSANLKLTYLNLWNNQLQTLDVKANLNLTNLFLSSNRLVEMDVSSNIHLIHLDLSKNKLSKMDVQSNIHLAHLYLEGNLLESMGLRSNVRLTHLHLNNNRLLKMDVSANVNLEQMFLESNMIAEIDLLKNSKLRWLLLQDNKLARICLAISGNVTKERYTDQFYFKFSDQESVKCQVVLICKGEVKGKAEVIASEWKKRYSQKGRNKHKCEYYFQVQ